MPGVFAVVSARGDAVELARRGAAGLQRFPTEHGAVALDADTASSAIVDGELYSEAQEGLAERLCRTQVDSRSRIDLLREKGFGGAAGKVPAELYARARLRDERTKRLALRRFVDATIGSLLEP